MKGLNCCNCLFVFDNVHKSNGILSQLVFFWKIKSLKDVCSCVSLSICKFLFLDYLKLLFELVQNIDSQKLNVLNHIFFPTFHYYSNICYRPHICWSLQILGYLEDYCKISPKATISYNLWHFSKVFFFYWSLSIM